MSDTSGMAKRWWRLLLWVACGLVVMVVPLIALAPTMLSGSLGCGLVADAIRPLVTGEVEVRGLALSWGGPQEIDGLAIRGEGGDEIVVGASVDCGLLPLLRQSQPLRVRVRGSVATRYDESGSFTIARLVRTPEVGAPTPTPTPAPAKRPNAAKGIPEGSALELSEVRILARPIASGPEVEISALSGRIALTGADLLVDLASPTRVGSEEGSLAVRGRAGGILAEPFSLDACSLELDANGTALAIPAEGAPLRVESLALKLTSARLADRVDATLRATIVLPAGSTATLSANLEASTPLDLERLSVRGRVVVDDLPSSALAPYLPAQMVASRDIGPTIKATVDVDGRAADIAVATDRLSMHAKAGLDESGDAIEVDSLAIEGRVDPHALPDSVRPDAPVAFAVSGSVTKWPLSQADVGASISSAACDLTLTLQPTTMSGPLGRPLSLGATTVSIVSEALGESMRCRMNSQINGARFSCDESINGLARVRTEGVSALHAKGHITLEPLRLDSMPWLDEATVAALGESAIDALSLEISNDGGSSGGSAAIKVGLGGSSTLATTVAFTPSGFTTEAIRLDHAMAPATVASLTQGAIVVSESVPVHMEIAALSGTWEALNKGVLLAGEARASIAVPRLALARAPGVRGAVLIEDLAAEVGIRLGDSAAPKSVSVQASWRAESGSALVAGRGRVNGSFERSTDHDAFTIDLSVPAITLVTTGRVAHAEPGGPLAIELGATLGEFSIPAQALADHPTSRGAVEGRIDLTHFKWRGRAQGSSCQGRIELKEGVLELPGRQPLVWGGAVGSFSAVDMTGEASLSLAGSVGVGGPATPFAIAAHVRGNLSELQLAHASGHIEAGLDQAQALAAWVRGSVPPSAPIVRVSSIKADFTVRSFATPSADHAGAADVTVELAKVRVEPEGHGAFDFGPARLTMKSGSFDHDLSLSLAAPDSIQVDADLKGDLRGFFDGATTPLALSASQIHLRVPGPLTLAALEWWRGGATNPSSLESLSVLDATLAIDSLRTARTGLADAAVKASVAVAPISLSFRGQQPIQFGATSMTIESAALGKALECSLTTGGVKAGSVEVRAHGTGQRDVAGAFAPLSGSWSASARVARLRTDLLDALLMQAGTLTEALGETVDVDVAAIPTTLADGTPGTGVHASIKTPTLTIEVPAARIGGGFIAIAPDAPVSTTLTINDALKKRLLEPINPVLSDIRKAPPIKATISRCAYPTDGDLTRFALDARIEFGDVEVVRSNQVIGVLALAQESKDATVPARIDPLAIAVQGGVLRYRDFVVKVGKFGEDWKQILTLSGEIDLTHSPPLARAISCRYPLASLGRTLGSASGPFTTTMRELSDQLQKLPVDPGMLFTVDVTLSGPLGEVNGQARPLDSKVKLAIDPSAIDAKKVKDGIKDIGQTIDGFRKLFGK